MPLFARILIWWVALMSMVAISMALFSHEEVNLLGQIVNSLLVLLGIISVYLYRRDLNKKNRLIFLNFSLYFLGALTNFIYPFVGFEIFNSNPYSPLIFYQYVGCGLIVLFLSGSVLYTVFDSLFEDLSSARKYVLTLAVVCGVAYYYYEPIIWDPVHAYKTEDIADWKMVDEAVSKMKNEGIQNPSAKQVASVITLNAWKDGEAVGILFEEQNEHRIETLLPYLDGRNFVILLLRPIHLDVIYMHVLSIIFIFVFFGYQYKNDPPQGAYVEKILFLFLPYCSLEILHYYAYATSASLESYLQLYTIGQYLTIVNLLLLVIFFSLRLSFITSIKGEFYERELVLDSEHISRWRDGIDNLVVRHFLNPKTLHGRLFAPRAAKSRT